MMTETIRGRVRRTIRLVVHDYLDKMLFRKFTLLSILAFGLCAAEKLHLPVPTCKHNATDYSTCLKNAFNEAWPLFVKGLPEFDFPSLDPFIFPYQKGVLDGDNLHAEVTVRNLNVTGLRTLRCKAVRPHFSDDALRLEIDYRLPKLNVYGPCEAYGTLAGSFQIGGKGKMNLTVGGARGIWDISGPVKDDTWIIEHFRINIMPKTFMAEAEDLFQGNREISDLAMMFVNKNWPPLYRILMSVATEYWDTYFSDLLTRFFAKLSFSEVFP